MPNQTWKQILAVGAAFGAGLTLASHPLAAQAADPLAPPPPGGLATDADAAARPADLRSAVARIETTPEWGRLTETLREAEAVASGAKGDYPFDQAGKQALIARIEALPATVDTLAGAGYFDGTAAELLKKEIFDLKCGVDCKRPKGTEMLTCYEPMMFDPAGASLKRVEERLPAIEKLAAGGKLARAVVDRLLAGVEGDLEMLANEDALARLKADEGQRARAARDRAKAAVERIRANATAGAPGGGGFEAVNAAFEFCLPLAKSGESTTAARDLAKRHLEAAGAAVVALRDKGELSSLRDISAAEADLLLAEMKLLDTDIRRNPPTDSLVKCYDMQGIPIGTASLERIEKRLSALKTIATQNSLNRRALGLVRDRLAADLANLHQGLKDKGGAFRTDDERKRAEAVARETDALALEIESLCK